MTDTKNYSEFTVTTTPFDADEIGGLLWELEPLGIEEQEGSLRLFFYEEAKGQELKAFLEGLKANGAIEEFTILGNRMSNKNWNEEWEKTITVIKVSDTLVVRPSFKEYTPVGNELVLVIDPKMSFGTGEHQTTRLMLLAIEKHITKDTRVLDVGTGTGALAIAALKLGASYAVAIDNDDWCLDNGYENAALNNIDPETISIRTAEVTDIEETDFDFVLANIQKNVLLDICESLVAKAIKGGMIILSGLLIPDEEAITVAYTKAGTTFSEKNGLDEWISLVFIKD